MEPEPTTEPTQEPITENIMTEIYLSQQLEYTEVLINRIEFLILIIIFVAFIYTFNTLRRYRNA